MNVQRRRLLQMSAIVGLMASTGLMTQAEAAAWNKAAFVAKSVGRHHIARARHRRKRCRCAGWC